MKDTWLVQRLETPRQLKLGGVAVKDNPFSFGGGYKNGGLSDDAMALLREIFSFDYMGAAEFELGAVPTVLGEIAKLADKKKLLASTMEIPLSKVNDAYNYERKKRSDPTGSATVYLLCARGDVEEVSGRVAIWAHRGYASRLKEPTLLNNVLRPREHDEYPSLVAGWLELDNGFMFFTSEEMWRKTCELFGVETPTRAG